MMDGKCQRNREDRDSYLLYLDRETMGEGDPKLGRLLLKAFLKTLPEIGEPPTKIVLVNRGVFLATADSAVREALKRLEESNCDILACGTCLDFYNLKEKLAVGRVSNMFEIAGLLCGPARVVRP